MIRPAAAMLKQIVGRPAWDAARDRAATWGQRARDRRANRRWRVSAPRIVVVSERGKAPHRGFLDWLGTKRPDLRRHVHLERVPCALPAGTALLHAWVQDPVAERDPALLARLQALEAECDRQGVPVVHRAAVLSHSRRDLLYARLAAAGVRTPRTVTVDASFDVHRGGLALPMVVRMRWGHNRGMHRLESDAAFAAWWANARSDPAAWVASEYVETASADGLYRKWRYFMAGAIGIARHLIVSRHWEVRPADRVKTPATRAEELAFTGAPVLEHALFDAARRALDFEIAAFDYSFEPGGGLVVWEVNPYPNLARPAGEVGDYLAPVVDRSYEILADFYAARAGL